MNIRKLVNSYTNTQMKAESRLTAATRSRTSLMRTNTYAAFAKI